LPFLDTVHIKFSIHGVLNCTLCATTTYCRAHYTPTAYRPDVQSHVHCLDQLGFTSC